MTAGAPTHPQARTFFRLEPGRALRVYDLLLASGWITGGGGGGGKGAGTGAAAGGSEAGGEEGELRGGGERRWQCVWRRGAGGRAGGRRGVCRWGALAGAAMAVPPGVW